jgi:hypothetical protein
VTTTHAQPGLHTPDDDAARDDADPAASGVAGVLAEFADVDSVVAAAAAVREAGYSRFDVHSPFPIHGIDDAIGVKPTILPWLVLGGGLTGMASGLFLTLYTMASTFEGGRWLPVNLEGYTYLISGKPYAALAAYIPVIFELTILLSAFAAVFGMFLLNKLPLLRQPMQHHPAMRRATQDRFVLAIDASDNIFDPDRAAGLLQDQPGVIQVDTVHEPVN